MLSISFVVVKADLLTEEGKDSSLGRPHTLHHLPTDQKS